MGNSTMLCRLWDRSPGGRFRTFDIDPSFVDALTIQASSQHSPRNKKFPPAATCARQLD